MRRVLALTVGSVALCGCSAPNSANIALRKQVQDLQDRVVRLDREHAADLATTRASTSRPVGSPDLSPRQLDTLFTVHGVRLGRLTTLATRPPDAPEGKAVLTVHVIPTDDDGNDLKAAGAIAVQAFDLKHDGHQLVDSRIDADATRKLWNGTGLRYEYVVPCPLDKPPAGTELTVRVTFTDALTGRAFDTQTVVTVPAD